MIRTVVLIALGASVIWTRDATGVFTLVMTGLLWALVSVLEYRRRLPLAPVMIADALLVGAICGISVATAPIASGALTVPPFAAAVLIGPFGVARALACEAAALALMIGLSPNAFTSEQGYTVFSWMVVSLGVGMVGTFIHAVLRERHTTLSPYRYAQALLRQLIDLSDGLDNGLNSVTLGGKLLWSVREKIPCTATALYVPSGGGLTPLVAKSLEDDLVALEEAAGRAYASGATVRALPRVAIPLEAGSGITAVLVLQLSPGIDARALTTEEKIAELTADLHPAIVHLDTALLFASFRDRASTEERRRLAREMHDGVAQDIASLGYLVDTIAAGASTDKQREQILILRDRISSIVGEVRRSLVNLRTDIGASESLGAAIAGLARNLAESTGVRINVSTDETTSRLRPEVEAELFRIVQEALTNALKHASASEIDVHCQVRTPGARITVSDNGSGLGDARADSHGLTIMRERAALVGAQLDLGSSPAGGVRVSVAIPKDGDPTRTEVTYVGPTFDRDTKVGT